MQLVTVLGQIGQEVLSSWIGKSTMDLLESLGEKNVAPRRLAKLVFDQYGPNGLLLDTKKRGRILAALKKDKALELCHLLEIDDADPWAPTKMRFSKNSKELNRIFSFFEVQLREPLPLPPTEKIVSPEHPLFDHQRNAYMEILGFLTGAPPRRALLHMPTGSGKTRSAMNVVAHFLREKAKVDDVVVWLAYSEELCEQAAGEFDRAWSAFGQRDLTMFRHFGGHRVNLAEVKSGFLIASLGLLYQQSLKYERDFLGLAKRAALVVFDEAHQVTAPTYSHLVNMMVPNPKVPFLGLSATPGRSWLDPGEDIKLAKFFGYNKVRLDVDGYESPIHYLQEEKYLAKVDYEKLEGVSGELRLTKQELEEINKGFDLPLTALARLGEDSVRNLQIIQRIEDEVRKFQGKGLDLKMLVFASSKTHAVTLANILRARQYSAFAVTGETPSEERRRVIDHFKTSTEPVILTNYGVLTTGFDAPRTNVALIARPTKSVVLYSQMIGRAIRGARVGGNERSKVITVVDKIAGFSSIQEGFEYWDDIWEDSDGKEA